MVAMNIAVSLREDGGGHILEYNNNNVVEDPLESVSPSDGGDFMLPLHSDYTVQTSNRRTDTTKVPPASLDEDDTNRRTIFGGKIKKKYIAPVSYHHQVSSERLETSASAAEAEENLANIPFYHSTTNGVLAPIHNNEYYGAISSTEETTIGTTLILETKNQQQALLLLSPMSSPTSRERKIKHINNGDIVTTPVTTHHRRHHRVHETRHAQSLLLGCAFCAIWTPSNLMAPNLTEMAQFFAMDTDSDRDLYLGSYCALAISVFSLPVAGAIGFWTDHVQSRKLLFVTTVLCGAVAAYMTGFCTHYWQLLMCRWINGGFMAGSVPVAFSFLGDLFDVSERNAASSGLTAMMGLGIIMGQVYAGTVGASGLGWNHAFFVSGVFTAILGLLCLCFVKDPERGGKEKALQEMIKAGTRYERKLTWSRFYHTIRHNESNAILLWQGFFSSLPWGVIFVFLNDYLSQERGFSIPDATFIVAIFGVGCAAGGILGGTIGQVIMDYKRSYLPLFMSATTVLGILPFVALLNSTFTNAHGLLGLSCAGLGGLVASLPAPNVRPCLINVNLPESRGASLTAATLLINLGRGVGPCCITLIQLIFHVNRKYAFNVTMVVFWLISGLQLLLLMKTLPRDQDAMEVELDAYAKQAISAVRTGDEEASLVSMEDRISFFNNVAAKETFEYVRDGIRELRAPCGIRCNKSETSSPQSENDLLNNSQQQQQQEWIDQEETMKTVISDQWTDETLLRQSSEKTPLIS